MKLIAVGDNVTDCYMDEGVYFPGGNAVNVAVNCRKNGAERVEYIGIFGIHILISAIVDKLEIIARARTVDKADMLIRIFISEGRGDGVDKGMTYLMVAPSEMESP